MKKEIALAALSGLGMYDRFACLQKLMEMQHTEEPYGYSKMVQTGDLDFCDYGTGFLCCRIYVCGRHGEFFVRLFFCTVDDGDLGAWSKAMPEAEAKAVVERVAQEWLCGVVRLGDLATINTALRPYGLFVTRE